MSFGIKLHFFLKLLIPMMVSMIFCILFTILYLDSQSKDWINNVSTDMQKRTLDYINTKLVNEMTNAEIYFSKISNDLMIFSNYTTRLYNNNIPIKNSYPSYFAIQEVSNNLESQTTNGINFENSVWYKNLVDKNNINNFENTNPEVNLTSSLNNIFRSLYQSNNNYILLYFGTETDGIMRKYPYSITNSYLTMKYTCVSTQTIVTGYDPRCRQWYHDAKINLNTIMFSMPYISASSKEVVITVSKSIISNGNMVGVIGGDVSMTNLYNTISASKILSNGFTFMMNKDYIMVVYPNMDMTKINSESTTLMLDSSQKEIETFKEKSTVIKSKTTGYFDYSRKGEKWYLFYANIPLTSYVLCMTVSENDILSSSNKLKENVKKTSTDYMIGTIIGAIIATILLGVINNKLANLITEPLIEFVDKMEQMTKANLDIEMEKIDPRSFDMTILHNQFKNLLQALRFGNEAYYKGDHHRALENYNIIYEILQKTNNKRGVGVCLNNIGNVYLNLEPIKALDYYEKAIENALELLHDFSNTEYENRAYKIILAKRYMNIGVYYKEKAKNYPEAKKYYTQSLQLHFETNNEVGIARVYGNLGQIDLILNDIASATENIIAGWEKVKNSNSNEAKEYASMNIGILEKHKKNYDMAIQWFVYVLTSYEFVVKNVKDICINELLSLYKLTNRKDIFENLKRVADASQTISRTLQKRDIIFVLDRSGSMANTPIEICKSSIKKIINENLIDDDYVSLITFDDSITNNFYFKEKRNNIHFMYREIDKIYVGNRTAFYKALHTAIDLAINQTDKKTWIIALTDGEDNCEHMATSQSVVSRLKSTNKEINIIVITVGYLKNIDEIMNICNASKKGKQITANNIHDIGLSFEKAAEFMTSEVEVERF
jgi:Mg-chelatase subunit ChlD